ncbi:MULTISPECIES: SAM-dependent methyltransferase [Porphyromonas]|uniref:SAM-dependent methyltransferase n=1 Tax=Porphyromonas TaxID=836 RepID=UPI00051DACC6|nr:MULTISPECIES: SAM-dependent methyltransferase [Porphyromonas]KGL51896.1 SAM-dependent methyltransferase [Porphyromonas canoris]KGN71931.1 SAM-dependent methyltransferase [Porphyromonas sp. COT-108 OH1349]
MKGKLYLIPSALSEVSSSHYIPPYNIEVIRSVKHFIVENARTARRFLKFALPELNISELVIVEMDKHNPQESVAELAEPLLQGYSVGLLSEAGCPAVADPGSRIVEWAHKKGVEVIPLVGPSSILLALMGSGFNGQRFAFKGYLPIDDRERASVLKEMERRISKEDETQIFIETPYRNVKLIEELVRQLPSQLRLCVAVNLTDDKQQKVVTKSLTEWKKEKDLSDWLHKHPAIFLLF